MMSILLSLLELCKKPMVIKYQALHAWLARPSHGGVGIGDPGDRECARVAAARGPGLWD